jgi:hypothetical protein
MILESEIIIKLRVLVLFSKNNILTKPSKVLY